MKNTATIITLTCAAVATIALVLYKPAARDTSVAIVPNNDTSKESIQHSPLLTQIASDQKYRESGELSSSGIEALKVIESGLRSLESDDGAERSRLAKLGNAAMESFLSSRSQIGKTPDELKALFGKPKEESNDYLLYSFDNGGYAWLYQFGIRNGRVVELTRPLSN